MLDEKKILEKAIAANGKTLQSVVACEEYAELIKEIVKTIRGEGNRNALIEEIADCEIMTQQIKMINDIDENSIQEEKKFKLLRLNDRINNK
ncbi:MAG: hypothetical protein KBT03_04035 [Bacteroidales bacterium]|nr:hypothetical protein [Candidatus Scybalousia scybalohippi]